MAHSRNKVEYNDPLKKNNPPLEQESVRKSLKKSLALGKILGYSQVVKTLNEKIDQIASCDVSVLLSGESGVGKELVARAIHYMGGRAGKPFVPVNCGALPENLFENEVFGHAKGAFTDAAVAQKGLVNEAEGGTLFLDEIGTISPYSQVKLLRLLQDKEYKALGDSRPRKADIRIIAATNTDLLRLVNEGAFRDDLFYRLNIVSIHIPPLRERREDIPVLVNHFLEKYAKEYDRSFKRLTKSAMELLCSYSWPGNIRELENKVQQLVVVSNLNEIDADHINFPHIEFPDQVRREKSFNEAKKEAVALFEKQYLVKLLTDHGGNVASSARKAGKSRTSLWNLLKKHNICPKEFSNN